MKCSFLCDSSSSFGSGIDQDGGPAPRIGRKIRSVFGLLLAFFLTAAAHAQMSGLGVSGIMITASGSGYTSPPNVSITGGGGSGAAATAIISGGYVTNVVITSPGSGYASAPDVSFANGGGSGASATAQVSGLVIENAPNLWAVVGGVYRYTPLAESNGAGAMITLTPLQLPPWLSFDGTLLSGTPTSDRVGLKDLVVIQATDTASNMTTYSFRINVGNTVGPVATTPSGGSVQWVTGMPQVARGGDTVLVTGVNGAGTIPTFWGLEPSGFGMEMNYNGPAGFGGDFTVPGNFAFSAGEIGTWLTGVQNLAGGTGVWLGNTHVPSSIGGGAISTYLSAQATGLLSAPVPFQTADTLGLDQTVGVVAQVGFNGGMSVAMHLNVNGINPAGTPALNIFQWPAVQAAHRPDRYPGRKRVLLGEHIPRADGEQRGLRAPGRHRGTHGRYAERRGQRAGGQ